MRVDTLQTSACIACIVIQYNKLEMYIICLEIYKRFASGEYYIYIIVMLS